MPVQSTMACAPVVQETEAVAPVPVIREYGVSAQPPVMPRGSQSGAQWPIFTHNGLWTAPELAGQTLAPPLPAVPVPTVLTPAPAVRTQDSLTAPYVISLMKRNANVSDAFAREIAQQFTCIPTNVRAALQRSGYHLTLSRTVPSAVPSTLGRQVRGYQRTTTWNNIFGMFNRGSKQVIMAEYAESEGAEPQLVTLPDSRRRLGILKHECGHAVDEMLQNYSHSAAFAVAYNKGVARLSTDYDRQMLEYYLQVGDAGKEEAFAEVFAIACGNGCHPDTDALLRRNFPELIALISRRIQSV